MKHFPLYFNLYKKNIIIFGGNKKAEEKIHKLLPCGAYITVISDDISDEIKNINGINTVNRQWQETDLDTYPLFTIITEDTEKTALIYEACRKRHIPVNAVDMPEYCDIIFPAVISGENYSAAVSSGGKSPAAAAVLKEKIAEIIPPDFDSIILHLSKIRNTIPPDKRKDKLKELARKAFDKYHTCEACGFISVP